MAAVGAKLPFIGMPLLGVERKWDFGTFRSVDGHEGSKKRVDWEARKLGYVPQTVGFA